MSTEPGALGIAVMAYVLFLFLVPFILYGIYWRVGRVREHARQISCQMAEVLELLQNTEFRKNVSVSGES